MAGRAADVAKALGVSVRTVERRRAELRGTRPQPRPAPPSPPDRRAALIAQRQASLDLDEISEIDWQILVMDDAELQEEMRQGSSVMLALIAHSKHGTAIDQVRTPERIAELALYIEQDERADAKRLLEAALLAVETAECP